MALLRSLGRWTARVLWLSGAHEHDAEHAVRARLRIIQAVRALRVQSIKLQARIGAGHHRQPDRRKHRRRRDRPSGKHRTCLLGSKPWLTARSLLTSITTRLA